MKSLFVLSFVLAVAAVNGDAYNTKNDGFDMEKFVKDKGNLKGLNHCFVGIGPCTETGNEFLKDIPDAITTSCVKCNSAQKNLFRVYITALKDLPEEYEAFKKKFDSEGKSFDQLEVNVGVAH